MSVWSETSPVVKGAMLLLAVALLYLGVAKVAHVFPFIEAETTATRGIAPPS